jgi:hypothetical protein
MARATYAKAAGNYDNTSKKAISQVISDVLTAGGMPKTLDTGQINLGTVDMTLDNANNILYGYEIREFTDALAATFPVVMRIEYRNGSNSNGEYAVWIQLGTGSNGAGTITGTLMPSTQVLAKDPNALRNCFVCVEPGLLAFAFHNNTGSSGGTAAISYTGHCSIERTHDQNGDDTSDGILFYRAIEQGTAANIAGMQRDFITYRRNVGQVGVGGGDTVTANNRGGTSAPPDNVTSGIQANGNEISVYRAPFYDGTKILHPMKAFVSVFANDYGSESVHTLNIDGDPAEYVGLQKAPYLCRWQTPNSMGTMMRYTA